MPETAFVPGIHLRASLERFGSAAATTEQAKSAMGGHNRLVELKLIKMRNPFDPVNRENDRWGADAISLASPVGFVHLDVVWNLTDCRTRIACARPTSR